MTTNPSISTTAGTSTGMSASTGGYRSHKRSRRQHTVRAMALAGITGLALITAVSPADAAAPRTRPKPPALLVSGAATWEERVNGDAVVTGPADVFTGRYEVLEAKRHNLVGTDGFFEVRLGVNGASAFAVDT